MLHLTFSVVGEAGDVCRGLLLPYQLLYQALYKWAGVRIFYKG